MLLDLRERTVLVGADAADLSDILTGSRTGPSRWTVVGGVTYLEIPWSVEPTAEQRIRVIARLTSRNAVEEQLVVRCFQALAANNAWLALPHPNSLVDMQAYLDTVARELNGLIRLMLRWLDTTD